MALPKNSSKQAGKVIQQKAVPAKNVNTVKGVGPSIPTAPVDEPATSIYPCALPESETATLLRELETVYLRFTSEVAQLEQSLLPVLPMNAASVSGLVLADGGAVSPQSPLATNLYHLMRGLECSVEQLSALRSQLHI